MPWAAYSIQNVILLNYPSLFEEISLIICTIPDDEAPDANGIRTFLHSPEDISHTFITQPRNMLTMAHTNYLCHYSCIEDALLATDTLTTADVFLNEWRVMRFFNKIGPYVSTLINCFSFRMIYLPKWRSLRPHAA